MTKSGSQLVLTVVPRAPVGPEEEQKQCKPPCMLLPWPQDGLERDPALHHRRWVDPHPYFPLLGYPSLHFLRSVHQFRPPPLSWWGTSLTPAWVFPLSTIWLREAHPPITVTLSPLCCLLNTAMELMTLTGEGIPVIVPKLKTPSLTGLPALLTHIESSVIITGGQTDSYCRKRSLLYFGPRTFMISTFKTNIMVQKQIGNLYSFWSIKRCILHYAIH